MGGPSVLSPYLADALVDVGHNVTLFATSIKDECLDRMISVGQGSLRRAVAKYMTHYHAERNHQGLENRLIVPAAMRATDGAVLRYARLGGTLNFYYRKAA